MFSVRDILSESDIEINGGRPWDIVINGSKKDLQNKIKEGGLVALGDSYVDGDWDTQAIDQFFFKLISSGATDYFENHPTNIKRYNKERGFNLQEKSQAKENIGKHYDTIPEEVFRDTLDKIMNYSCGYWEGVNNLDDAQEAKLELICKKLELEPGMKVLDIGSGWGAFVKFATERYGVEAVGLTISDNQAEFSRKSTENLPVEIRQMDYRDLDKDGETFDRIASIGMFEHVGHMNYRTFMESANRSLVDGGLFLLHNFGGLYATPNQKHPEAGWVEKHIFPNMALPSIGQLATASEGLFNVLDVHNFGVHYDPTLMAWADNFKEAWPKLSEELKSKEDEAHSSERFFRTWDYYLKSCAGAFRSEKYQLWQTVFSKDLLDTIIKLLDNYSINRRATITNIPSM